MTSPAPEPPTAPYGQNGQTRLNATALLSLVASLFGFVCFWGFGGLLGIVLGLVARSEVERSEGREHGRGLATAGLILGLLNVASFVIGIAVLAAWMASPGSHGSTPTVAAPAPPPALVLPSPRPAPEGSTAEAAADEPGQASRERDTRSTLVGSITVVDPGSSAGRLPALLHAEQATAVAEKQKLVLWIVTPECSPCNGIAAALPDRRLQRALDGVRLLRVDLREFSPDLERLGIPTEKIPGFALLGPDLRPLDFVDGGEWDADIPVNIAPVLGAFVRGTYTKRRQPWRGTLRGGETAL